MTKLPWIDLLMGDRFRGQDTKKSKRKSNTTHYNTQYKLKMQSFYTKVTQLSIER
jgi:hypothetical protein